MKYKKIKLNKGATLYYVKNNINKISNIEISFDCGARCDEIPGMSHLIEHMFFTGTKKYNDQEITKMYFDFIGSNAYTSSRNIAFSGDILTKELENYVKLVSMLINETTFAQKNIDKEVKVVQQEISVYNDKYNETSYDFNLYNLTGLDVPKYGILGSNESVASVTTKDIKKYVKKYFVTENMNIFLVTPLSLTKVKKMLERTIVKEVPSKENFEKLPVFYYKNYDKVFYKSKYKEIDKCYVYINFPIKQNIYDLEFANKFRIVTRIMNDTSDGLNKTLRQEKSLVYYSRINALFGTESGSVGFMTECDKKNVDEVIKTVIDYYNSIYENGFEPTFLKKSKRIEQFMNDRENAYVGKERSKLKDLCAFGKVPSEKKDEKIRKKLTIEECNSMFREAYNPSKLSVSVFGDIKKSEYMSEKEFRALVRK